MICHITAFLLGFILDLIIGDPYWMPHPVRLMGSFISVYDKAFFKPVGRKNAQRIKGLLLVLLLLILTGGITAALLFAAYKINIFLGIGLEAVLSCYAFAAKSLKTESMKVYKALQTGDIDASRKAVSMIVGRDTQNLDMAGVARAAVETVAENTSDGVIAPLLYTCIGGPVLGMLYKAVNTMDSMVGYHNDKYENYGFFAAKLDDIVNLIPARLSAVLMIIAAAISGREYDAGNALRIFKRDRFNHKSPNSAQTESVCAGALKIRLAGDASYFGKIVKKPFIGDDDRPIETEDIKRANRLMLVSAWLMFIIGWALLTAVMFIMPRLSF